jgi:4,5-DOPA dioxygenase extradiol
MPRLPILFVSHGSPMFAVDPGIAGPALTALGRRLARPKAVLIVSPHWMTREPRVSTTARPETVHDFGGFPPALYKLNYPAPGHPALASRAIEVLRAAGWAADADAQRGLDHGAWVPLTYLFAQADVPVFQVSLPARMDGARAYALGQALAPLADEGVLIVGSGSLTHNLSEIEPDHSHRATYVAEFAAWVAQTVLSGDHASLQQIMARAPHAEQAHPTTEHLWPLLVAAGAAGAGTRATHIDGGVVHGVLSMDAYLLGAHGAVTKHSPA